MKSLSEIVAPEIKLVDNTEIREVLFYSYENSLGSLNNIQQNLSEILKSTWPDLSLCSFFKNW